MIYRFMTTDADTEAGYEAFGMTISDEKVNWPDVVRAAVKQQDTPAYRIGWFIVDPETAELECIGTADELY